MSRSEKANQTARSIILPVDGLTCAACSRGGLEQAIGRLDGVEQASVSIATNRAAVSFNPAKVRIADIKLAHSEGGLYPLAGGDKTRCGGGKETHCQTDGQHPPPLYSGDRFCSTLALYRHGPYGGPASAPLS